MARKFSNPCVFPEVRRESAWKCGSSSPLSPGQEGARPKPGHPRGAGCSGVPADHRPLAVCVCMELGSLRAAGSGGESNTGIFAFWVLPGDVCPNISLLGAEELGASLSLGWQQGCGAGLPGSGCLGQGLCALPGESALGSFWLPWGLNSGIWLSGVLLPHGLEFSLSPE